MVCRKFRQTTQYGALEGKTQSKEVKYYNLEGVISVGYRVKAIQRFMFRLLQPSHSSPSAIAFVSSSHRIWFLWSPDSTPSATAFDSFSHRSRLIQLMQSSPSANSAVCVNSMKWMNSWNEVHELVKWSGWTCIMKFMISAQLSIHAIGKAKRSLLLLFPILFPSSVKILAKSGYFSLFNSEIEWNIRENP